MSKEKTSDGCENYDEKVKKGRPKKRWMEVVEEDMGRGLRQKLAKRTVETWMQETANSYHQEKHVVSLTLR